MKHLNQTLNGTLEYLCFKYPQMKEAKPNKRLRESISSLNNMESDENDMVWRSKIQFVYKENGEYTSEIMEFFNFLIGAGSDKCVMYGKETTYFKGFFDMMEKIFTWVEVPSEIISEEEMYKIITKVHVQEEE